MEKKNILKDSHRTDLKQLFTENSFPEDAFYIDKIFNDKNIIVYGAGESFHYYKEIIMRGYGYIPTVILDQKFKKNDTFLGIPASPPHEYKPDKDVKENSIVVICLGSQTYYNQIVDTLVTMGFKNIISLNDIYEIHNAFQLPVELEQSGFQYYLDRQSTIESCYDLLEDDESREVFIKIIETHMKRKPVIIPMRPRTEQYVPKDIRLSRGYSRYIYCGVSVGEMASVFNHIDELANEMICFEPDPNQYRLTKEYLKENYFKLAKRVTALPNAVYDRTVAKPFTWSDTSFGSRILDSHEIPPGSNKSYVQCVTIDDILHGFCPTFISMDIEGAELNALKGAENVIKENIPDLGICVYHSPNHIWEIPHYLDNLGLGYKFYLRNYTSLTGETVLYATRPAE